MAFVAALVRDPGRGRRDGSPRCSTPTGRVRRRRRLGPDVRAAALDLGDCMLALYPVPPDEATSRAVWGGRLRPPAVPRVGAVGRGPGRRRARARGRRRRACTTAARDGASCSIRPVCRSRSCSPSSCSPAIPAPRGHRRTDGGTETNACGGSSSPSTTAVLTMELQNGVVGEGAMLGALVDELSGRARSTRSPALRRRHATPAHASCTAPSCRVPTARVRRRTARSSRSSARQRREQGHGATDLGTPGAEVIAGLEDPRHRRAAAPRHDAVHVDLARPDPAQPRDPYRHRDRGVGEPRRDRHGPLGARPRVPGRDPTRRGGRRARASTPTPCSTTRCRSSPPSRPATRSSRPGPIAADARDA